MSGSEVNFFQFRLLGLMEKAASSITLKDILKKYPVPSNYSYSMKDVLDKKLSLGKVEVSVEVRSKLSEFFKWGFILSLLF